MTFEVEFKLKGAFREDAEAGVWVAYCPALKVYSQGTDRDEARKALIDAAGSFVLVSLERGALESALAKRGFSPSRESSAQAKASEQTNDEEWISVRQRFDKGEFDFKINVPYHLAHTLNHQTE
jgi:predicted RNase H-like HicB family nuclease